VARAATVEDLRIITKSIIGSGFAVHTALGPGLFERVYRDVLAEDMRIKGLRVEIEKVFPIVYKGKRFPKAFRVDLTVERKVLVEIKMVTQLAQIHQTQLLTYLRLLDLRVGLLLNFGTPSLVIKRIANQA
jgi:iron complex transport system substrate-binding protein